MLTVTYQSIDGAHVRRRFASLKGARAFAVKWVGASPDLGSHYAISDDGVGKITVVGCSLEDLFGAVDEQAAYEAAERAWAAQERARDLADAEAHAAEMAALTAPPSREAGCSCSEEQLHYVGCECPRDDAGVIIPRAAYHWPAPLDDDMPF
jgi:hypothetical protein